MSAVDVAKVDLMLGEPRLPAMKAVWQSTAERADKEGWPAARLLGVLAEQEVADRTRRRFERHLSEAKLPPGKTLANFEFDAVPMVSKAHVNALVKGDRWLDQGANLILIGPPGGGKSHLAAAIGLGLVENGFRVLYARTTDLVQRLQVARRELNLEAAVRRLARFHLLILDDIAYVRKDQAETSALFELISSRYEHRSMLITANQPFGEWGSIFPDQAMTLAAVDRLVHRATIFEMNVESYRRREAVASTRQAPRPDLEARNPGEHRGGPETAARSRHRRGRQDRMKHRPTVVETRHRERPLPRSPPLRQPHPVAATLSHPDCRGRLILIDALQRSAAPAEKRLFSYPDINGEPEETRHAALSPYLFDAGGLSDPHLVVREESVPINRMGKLLSGSQPIDNGEYIFNAESRAELLEAEPDAGAFLRPYVGAREYLQGGQRWILALQEASPTTLRSLPCVRERMAAVRKFRAQSKRKSTLAIADYPTRYNVEVIPTAPFLVIPEVSSERREYAPIGWLEPPVIPSNLVRILENASVVDFALLTSAMHMAWLRHIGGRLKSDYRYSIGLVYNTFPLPPKDSDLSLLEPLAQAVVDGRACHSGATLADLYDPDLMPPDLRRAHWALDRAVDRLYRRAGFGSERERIEHLFMLYEKMRMPLATTSTGGRRRRR